MSCFSPGRPSEDETKQQSEGITAASGDKIAQLTAAQGCHRLNEFHQLWNKEMQQRVAYLHIKQKWDNISLSKSQQLLSLAPKRL